MRYLKRLWDYEIRVWRVYREDSRRNFTLWLAEIERVTDEEKS